MNLKQFKNIKNKSDLFKALSRMANEQVVFPSNAYAGDADLQVIRRAVFNTQIIGSGLVTVVPGIKKQRTMHKYKSKIRLGDRTSDFTVTPQAKTLDKIVLTPVVYEFKEVFDYTNLRDTWFAEQVQQGAMNDRIPPEVIAEAVISFIDETMANINDALYLRGKARTPQAGFTAAYTGLEEKIAAAANSKKLTPEFVTFSAVAISGTELQFTLATGGGAKLREGDLITVTGLANGGGGNVATFLNNAIWNEGTYDEDTTQNIMVTSISGDTIKVNVNPTTNSITIGTPVYTNAKIYFINEGNVAPILLKAWRAIPETVKANPDFKMWVHPAIQDAFVASEAGRLGGLYTNTTDLKQLSFLGQKLERVQNMSPLNVIGIQSQNALIGVDDVTDSNVLNIVDLFGTTNEYFSRYRMSMATCTEVPLPEQALIVRPT
jgi:hypothetical protein